eukprot:Tamp_34611.p2 GENE.Tamp_34611~~Tamp_34611.p2  ORF type:complete len:140 (-),score=9.72 Tamp_34611:137-556(-)
MLLLECIVKSFVQDWKILYTRELPRRRAGSRRRALRKMANLCCNPRRCRASGLWVPLRPRLGENPPQINPLHGVEHPRAKPPVMHGIPDSRVPGRQNVPPEAWRADSRDRAPGRLSAPRWPAPQRAAETTGGVRPKMWM